LGLVAPAEPLTFRPRDENLSPTRIVSLIKGVMLGLECTDGLVVSRVYQSGQASNAGVKTGERIVLLNGLGVSTVADVRAALNATLKGAEVKLELQAAHRQWGGPWARWWKQRGW
jgi:S1-C subfamily serine protease